MFLLNLVSPFLLQRLSLLELMSSSLYVRLKLVPDQIPCDPRVCQAASEVSSDYDDLLDLFECLGNFLKRLEVYTNIPPTQMMTDVIVKILIELLSVLVLARKQMKRGRFSTCTIKYRSKWLSVWQGHSQGRFSETTRSRLCFSGWTD
jgi:hypothetical protein